MLSLGSYHSGKVEQKFACTWMRHGNSLLHIQSASDMDVTNISRCSHRFCVASYDLTSGTNALDAYQSVVPTMVDDRTFENLYNNSIHFPQEGAYNLYDPWRDVFLGFRRIDYYTNDNTAKYKRAAWSDGYRKQIESHIGTPIADVLNAYEATMFGDAAKLITGLSSTKRKKEEQLVKMWSLFFRRNDFVDWMDIDSVIKFFTDNNWISLSRSLLAVRYKQQVLLVSGSMPVAVYGQRGFMLKQQAGELFEKDLMMLGIPYRIYKRLMRGDVVSW